VSAKKAPYNVYVGSNILKNTGAILRSVIKGSRVLVVSNPTVYALHGKKLLASLSARFKTAVHLMQDGERYKTLKSVEAIYNAAAKSGLDRYSAIVALGGGVVGDTAGFAAATYMRGIPVVQVPTTLLAMFDSSIGGKTGVDIGAGKNMAGAFHQPLFVISDIDVLQTLPPEEYCNGMAELIKHGIVMDAPLFNFINSNRSAILKKDKKALLYIVKRSAFDKAKVVAADEKETKGIRAILNYGHTIGHAIEAEGQYRLYRHGEAISLGMAAAARIAYKMGLCRENTVKAQIQILNAFNLIKPLKNLKTDNIIKRMYSDKKAKDGKIRFILTTKIGHVKLIESVPITIIRAELKKLFYSEAL